MQIGSEFRFLAADEVKQRFRYSVAFRLRQRAKSAPFSRSVELFMKPNPASIYDAKRDGSLRKGISNRR